MPKSTSSSAFFTVQIMCPILMSPNPWRASVVRYLLYELNRIIDKQHPDLTPLPLFTLLIGSWSSLILTLCPIQFADQSCFASIDTSSLYCLHQFCPVCVVRCLLPVYEASTDFLIYVQRWFCYYAHHPLCIPISLSSSDSKQIFSK